MFKPVRGRTFLRDFLVIQVGLGMYGAAIAVMIRAGLGISAWQVLDVALSKIVGVTPGIMTMISGACVLVAALSLREQIGWGTLANILSIGPWLDLTLRNFPEVPANLPLQLAMLLLAILMMGVATGIYIGVDAGAGPRDSLMLALHRKLGWSLRRARGTLEIVVVAVGWLLGGPAGVGTVVFALLIGSSVQWALNWLKVVPHRPAEAVG